MWGCEFRVGGVGEGGVVGCAGVGFGVCGLWVWALTLGSGGAGFGCKGLKCSFWM